MDKNTFGSFKEYKTLEFLTEKIGELDNKKKEYLNSFITNFNTIIKKINLIEDKKLKLYILLLVKEKYKSKIDTLKEKGFNIKIVTYVANFVDTKIKKLMQ